MMEYSQMLLQNQPHQCKSKLRTAASTWCPRRRRTLPHLYACLLYSITPCLIPFKSYAAAQADAVPPYWDTIVHVPAGMDTDAGMIVGDLPSGSIFSFISNLFASFFVQFVGFLITYLLHTTHAAKFGSRAGLGLTLIQYGFFSHSATEDILPLPDGSGASDERTPPSSSAPIPQDDNNALNMSSRGWISFLLMTLGGLRILYLLPSFYSPRRAGWFLLLSSSISFWRVKNWESAIRASNAREPYSAEEITRDISTGRNIEQAFHIAPVEEPEHTSLGSPFTLPTPRELTEADLRAAGVL